MVAEKPGRATLPPAAGARRVRPRRLQLPDGRGGLARVARVGRACSTRRRRAGAARRLVQRRARPAGRAGRPVRRRQDDDQPRSSPRLYDVTRGRGAHRRRRRARRHASARCATAIGVVTQDAHLFHDTIRANLLYAQPGRHRRGAARGARGRPDPAARRLAARRPRHRRRRPRLPALRRREAAPRDRPAAAQGARRSWSSTRRPPTSTPSPRRAVQRALDARSPAAPRSSSRTGSRPSARPTRSWSIDDGRIVERGTPRRAARRRRPLRRALPDPVRQGGLPAPDARSRARPRSGEDLRMRDRMTAAATELTYDARGGSWLEALGRSATAGSARCRSATPARTGSR